MKRSDRAEVLDEFAGVKLGDARRQARLKALVSAVAKEPRASLPIATKTVAALEAAYRFLGNSAVSMDAILAGHYSQTVERAAQEDLVLALHDTSEFRFPGESDRGLGPLRGHGQGFFGHFSLLVTSDELRRPLGVLNIENIIRQKKPRGRPRKGPKTSGQSLEATRWKRAVAAVEDRIAGRTEVVHVMDREGDSYDLWAELSAAGHRFVIRNSRERLLEDGVSFSAVVASGETLVERDVYLSRRKEEKILFNRKRHPARAGRPARLAVSAQTIEILRPQACQKTLPAKLAINFVHVREVGTNGSEAPVEWTLATSEPIATVADVLRVVDIYRARWVIEEYFKSLKTGCSFEKRQLESERSIFNALAIFVPIAWRLLLLRTLARDHDDAPATEALTPTLLKVLAANAREKLSPNPTVREAMLAIAGLGGHIKNNGDPGWIVLGRGFEYLLILEQGWLAAKRSDQS
jgi:Transposase DNA-binding/Transposase DDE domain